ncbi:ParB/RepB/Spo0J family partition protein [Piscirickettsia litoralis]|uniref:ParB-like N-terminal domain-containing protein n=1 Tax=Piscirickettsia litoralis TaxID=1891921 RepID=A0ABX3A1L1_9GAMM|nr:ParB/RepB/Spo0J family partition protein [Piscirickettsia litoralis]ODN41335.1 hypothetical protein BGC07_16320 [Piscirickettsia litoralis]
MLELSEDDIDLNEFLFDKTPSHTRTVMMIETDHILTKKQVRKSFEKIDELAASIQKLGIQQPIIVYPCDGRGRFTIKCGERRWRAAKHIGLKRVPVIVDSTVVNEPEMVVAELVENTQREPLTALEIAHALDALYVHGLTHEEIGLEIGKSRQYVTKHLRLLDMPQCIMSLYDRGIVKDVSTLNSLLCAYEIDEARTQRLCEQSTSGISRHQAQLFCKGLKLEKEKTMEKQPLIKAQPLKKELASYPSLKKEIPPNKNTIPLNTVEVELSDGRRVKYVPHIPSEFYGLDESGNQIKVTASSIVRVRKPAKKKSVSIPQKSQLDLL